MAYSPMGVYFSSENKILSQIVKKMCVKYSCDEDEILLSWLNKHESGIHPVIGTTKKERIKKS